MTDLRIGQGFDAHRLVEGRKLILMGVDVPYERGLLGHSDADVAAHAVADAVLGAMAMRDIGYHFPPGDPAYEGADSMELLARVAAMVRDRGYRVVQADVTILAEKPRLKDYIPTMRENLSRALDIDLERASVKATTTEGMGYIGREEGMAAMAVALLEKSG